MTKKIVYSTTKADFWLQVAIDAQSRYGLEPVFWITTDRNRENILKIFPACICHDSIDLGRGLDAKGEPICIEGFLDETLLRNFAEVEHMAIEMMDRMDLDGSFSVRARKRLFNKHLAYSLKFLLDIQPDIVFFVVPPHLPGEYVLYEVSKYLGINTKILLPTSIGEYSLIVDSLNGLPQSFQRTYEKNLRLNELALDEATEREIQAVIAEEDPWYYVKNTQLNERKDHFMEYARTALEDSRGVVPPLNLDPLQIGFMGIKNLKPHHADLLPRAYSIPGKALETTTITSGEFQCYLRWSCHDKVLLEAKYSELAVKNESLDGNYIFLALHYQPERTTSPDGGRFNNQFLMASMLATSLPSGWRLLIKEHPSQFSFRHTGNQSRNLAFYEDLAALPNTVLISLDTPSRHVLKNAAAVATVTGFVGWEAICRGKPAIVFGNAWYQACDGVYRVHTLVELRQALMEIVNLEFRDYANATRAYAKTVKEEGVLHLTLASEERISSLYPNPPPAEDILRAMVDRLFGEMK